MVTTHQSLCLLLQACGTRDTAQIQREPDILNDVPAEVVEGGLQ